LPAGAAASPSLPVFDLRADAYKSRISVQNPRMPVTSQAVCVPHVTDGGTVVSFAEIGIPVCGVPTCHAVMMTSRGDAAPPQPSPLRIIAAVATPGAVSVWWRFHLVRQRVSALITPTRSSSRQSCLVPPRTEHGDSRLGPRPVRRRIRLRHNAKTLARQLPTSLPARQLMCHTSHRTRTKTTTVATRRGRPQEVPG
jgi:hypothetical protein